MKTGFRTEQFSGEGYRNAAEVMAHEVFELQNTDILVALSNGILKGTQIGTRMLLLIDGIENNTDDEDMNRFLDDAFEKEYVGVTYFRVVLNVIKRITGKDIKYVLWLCDSIDDVKNSYEFGDNVYTEFDEYETSDIVLSDIGREGKLYGYETMPKPIKLKPYEGIGGFASCNAYENGVCKLNGESCDACLSEVLYG